MLQWVYRCIILGVVFVSECAQLLVFLSIPNAVSCEMNWILDSCWSSDDYEDKYDRHARSSCREALHASDIAGGRSSFAEKILAYQSCCECMDHAAKSLRWETREPRSDKNALISISIMLAYRTVGKHAFISRSKSQDHLRGRGRHRASSVISRQSSSRARHEVVVVIPAL